MQRGLQQSDVEESYRCCSFVAEGGQYSINVKVSVLARDLKSAEVVEQEQK